MDTKITTFIQNINPLPNDILEEVISYFQHLEYPKNYFLLKQGRPCKHLWFLVQGAVRYFYTDEDGKDSNVWFSLDTDVITEAPSFVSQKPSYESIQLLEDSELYAIERNNLYSLLQRHHSFAIWYISLVEKHYVFQIEERISDLQFLTAKQRYEKLFLKFPNISNRINLGHIASYLNITQETLSRIRSGKL
ncbi:Crp/Fnr family transcriptional regulator [Runella slithyformis]|uniref:Transcriptional regulator, Crp/Fnr family n=1 Tax=Runella slithyformis (strain ATCC 29530 / DSM 19594 / LMG 11500 / NCIMB 11436 / LSU 4) TaxID=761193 RepID=A0A7U3ZQ94_RUNSL|nr:Crp/Fnr family transcriptional regulator [Runella slithyformis]AEI51382.1 putative transcriptional regulator, Crp/Fnr family [Runella slithyformis DSM 19594]